MNLSLFGMDIMKDTLFTNIMSIAKVMSIYLSFISGGITTLFTVTAGDFPLVYFSLQIITCDQRYLQLS